MSLKDLRRKVLSESKEFLPSSQKNRLFDHKKLTQLE